MQIGRDSLLFGIAMALAGCGAENEQSVEATSEAGQPNELQAYEMTNFQTACEEVAEILMPPNQTETCATVQPGDIVLASESDARSPTDIDGAFYLRIETSDGVSRWIGVGTEPGASLEDWARPAE